MSLLPALPVRGETAGGRLDVVSDPSGSYISINGRHFGVTPLTGVELAPGRYVIQAAKSGHEPLERWVDVEAMGASLLVSMELETLWVCRVLSRFFCVPQER